MSMEASVSARKGKKVGANAVGGAQESTLRTARRETHMLDQWEAEEKVSCLMMCGAARAFHGVSQVSDRVGR